MKIFDICGWNWSFMPKTSEIWLFLPLHRKMLKMTCFWHKTSISTTYTKNLHKITSYFYGMRKVLTKKFWSLGTNLGSPGSLSQDCSPEIFSKLDFPHIWGLNECPVVAKPCVLFKKLKSFRPGCGGILKKSQ